MSFPAYPTLADSGIEWVGAVPNHWVRRPLFALVAQRNQSNAGMVENNLLSLSYGRIVRKNIDNNDGLLPASFETYQIVEPNDIVWRLTDLQNDKRSLRTAMTSERGIITSAYLATQPRDIDPNFLNYLLRAYDLAKVFYSMGGGLRQSMKFADVKWLPVMLPPRDEQGAIALFLDRETAKIDALIEEQRCLIALLKEKRQATISQAVAKGLDPNASMKDSGIEWLGKIPAHWRVVPLKFLASLQTGLAKGKDYGTAATVRLPYLRVANVQNGHLNLEEVAEIDVLPTDVDRYRLRVGDVLMNEGGDFDKLGRGDVWEGQIPDCLHQNHVFAVRPTKISSSWLNLVNGSDYAQRFFILRSKQTTNLASISSSNLMELPVLVPPVDEQSEIEANVLTVRSKLDALIFEAERAIVLLNERRAALISSAVTGKIDVRPSAQIISFPIDRARTRGLIATEIISRMANRPTFGRVKLQKLVYLAEAHVGVSELGGNYLRMPAGPLDSAMVEEMEREAGEICGVVVEQPAGPGTAVTYRVAGNKADHKSELERFLGPNRTAKLAGLIKDMGNLDTKGAEAVATLYAVWNDALIDGDTPNDDGIVAGFLNEWHPEKPQKFRTDELHTWLDWMRRHDLVPAGAGPQTYTGRLFV